MPTVASRPIVPSAEERRSIASVHRILEEHPGEGGPCLLGSDGEKTPLPAALYEVLLQAVRELEQGHGVSVVPSKPELTTQQAADLLNVSRPFLIRLLKEGLIPHRMVGTHRRVALGDLLAYREARSTERKRALGKLAREEQELGHFEI